MNILNKIFAKLRDEGILSLFRAFLRYPSVILRKLAHMQILSHPSIEERFIKIYDKNFWESKESKSGEGSEVIYTENLRKWLLRKIPHLDVKVFLDAPCGDFNWMKEVMPLVNMKYIGLDIVPSLIENNKKKYFSENIDFMVGNICTDELPACDLIMVRDCLFHLSYFDINNFLSNLANTDYKYLLTTSHITNEEFENSDIASGNFRLINLFLEPFNFIESSIIDSVDDFPVGYPIPRQMILLEKDNVPKSINL